MNEFFDMGGYGLFVWPAYGLVVAVLLGVALASWRGERRAARLLRRMAHSARRGRAPPATAEEALQ